MKIYEKIGYYTTPEKRERADRRMRLQFWGIMIFEALFLVFVWFVTRK